jgi:predicted HicB family RNase H-like nuclease
MTGKKIEFSKKPTARETNQFIDDWVSGNTNSKNQDKKLKRTTIYLPEELHKKLKIQAADNNTSMTLIIIEALEKVC